MEFVVTQGRIVLFRTGIKRYSPALINRVNVDGSVQLTVFDPQGSTSLASNVQEGDQVGNWVQPGVDAREKIAAEATEAQKKLAETGGPAKPLVSAPQPTVKK